MENENTSIFNGILENAVYGIITIDAKGTLLSLNKAANNIFGYAPKEVVGENIKILMPDPYHSNHDGYLQHYADTGEKKVIGFGREVPAKRKNGKIFYISLAVSEAIINNQKIFSAIVSDITKQKKAEEETKKYLDDLKISNHDLDEFAYIASHDLKEPLRGLTHNALFLKEDYSDLLGENGIKRLERMSYLCNRIEQLLDNLLYFSRLGRQELVIKKVDIKSTIDNVIDMMDIVIKENNVEFLISDTIPKNIICDSIRIAEVFRNLITNAIKYNNSEKKIIEIGYIDSKKDNQEFIFYVKDNGIGIPEKFYDDIFKIFKRLNQENDSVKGNGVGLTFVKKIIERHNGKIWIESNEGQGTIFYFSIINNES